MEYRGLNNYEYHGSILVSGLGPKELTTLWFHIGLGFRVYGRSNYQHVGFISLIYLWSMVHQVDLNMISVIT